MSKIQYIFAKWEKRRDKLLGYESMIVLRINSIKEAIGKERKAGIVNLYLLALSYVDLVTVDYIQQRKDDFYKHLRELLDYMNECISILKEGSEIPEATRKSLFDEYKAGYWGYFALIVQDLDTLKYLTDSESTLVRMMEQTPSAARWENTKEIEDMQNAIVGHDSEMFNLALRARIQSIRKMPTDYVLCLDIWSFALLRYAECCGMQVDRNRYAEADLERMGF